MLFFLCKSSCKVNKIAFISGIGKNRVAKGKLVIYLRFFERVDYLDLSVFSVDVNTAVAVPTNDFINIKVDAVVNLQVDETAGILEIAAKNFLNRKSSDIAISVKDVLEGNLREIVGQMQLKEIVQNRKNFNEKVQENVAPDLREMGLKVISFNVQNFQEDKQVIENLGAENISKISKEASIARAEADKEKEIEIAKANANKEAMDIKLKTEQDIAEKENALAIKKAELKVKADTEKAKADVTYELEKERKRKEIEEVTGLSNLVREQKAIETNKAKYEAETIVPKQADAEARKVEKTKEAEAKKIEEQQAAEAKLYKEQREAEAIKLRALAEAEGVREKGLAEAEATRQKGLAEAESKKALLLAEAEGVREKGLAEAEALDKKAEAMAKYGDAAKLEMYYNALPLVAKNLAEPLSKIGNITMYGEGNTTKFMSEMTQNLDKVLKAATDGLGIDAKALLTSYLGGKIAQNKNQSSKDEVIETEEK